jgi:hypothetical protein
MQLKRGVVSDKVAALSDVIVRESGRSSNHHMAECLEVTHRKAYGYWMPRLRGA